MYTYYAASDTAITGTLVVQNAAAAQGFITNANIVSFSFFGPQSTLSYGPFETNNLLPGISVPVDGFGNPTASGTGAPITALNTTVGQQMVVGLGAANGFEMYYDPINIISTSNEQLFNENGYWVASLTSPPPSVPEPPSAVLAVIAAVCGLAAYGWSRHRRDQRQQRPVGTADAPA
jgi:hypothetical protein